MFLADKRMPLAFLPFLAAYAGLFVLLRDVDWEYFLFVMGDPPRHWDIFLSVFHRGDVIQLPGARKFREKDITGEKHAMLATVAGLAFYGDARSCRRTRINSWPFSLIPHEIFWTFYPLAITVCYYKWGYFLSCILFCRKFFIPFFVIAQMRFLEVLCNFCCLTNY